MTKPILQFIALLILLLVGNETMAQSNYQPAQVVSTSGDTLKGLIDYQNWVRNPSFILFRNTSSDRTHKFTAVDIQSFRAEEEYYRGAILAVDKTPRETKDLSFAAKPLLKTDTVFLRVILSGKAILYTLVDKSFKQHYFIEKDSSGIHELIFIRYLKEVQNKTSIQENKKYKGQLNYFFSDCPELRKDISKTEYRYDDLVKLFKKYNRCMGLSNTEEFLNKKKNRAKIQFGFLLGGTLTSIKFKSDLPEMYYLTKTSFSASVKPAFGISVNFILPTNQQAWSIYSEFAYNAFSFSETYRIYHSSDSHTTKSITLDYGLLRWANMVRYHIPKKQLKIFFQLGVSQGFVLNSTDNVKVETWWFGDLKVENSTTPYSFSYDFGIVGGIGLEYKKFGVELRYIGFNKKVQVNYLSSSTRTLLLYISYHL